MNGDGQLDFPAGFRFHPTDEELVSHYLIRRCEGNSISVPIIAEIDLYKFDPWQLPDMALYGEKEWYFFSPRDRKYPNGSRPNRAAGTGYWKATGADKPIGRPKALGIKKALVFYAGKAPKGIKTNWIMHEYRLANVDRSAPKKNNSRLDDWVLCRIYNKKGKIEKHNASDNSPMWFQEEAQEMKPDLHHHDATTLHVESSDSFQRFQTDSSGSEHVLSPELHKEVQSEARWNDFDFQFDSLEKLLDESSFEHHQGSFQMDQGLSFQDMFIYSNEPF